MASGNAELYERDFFEWTQATAAALRKGDLAAIARKAAAEEIEDMGKNHLSAVLSRATVLITHMLKWQFQAAPRSRSWLLTITVQRRTSVAFSTRVPASAASCANRSKRSTGMLSAWP